MLHLKKMILLIVFQETFKRVVAPKASKFEFEGTHKKKKKGRRPVKDEEFYIPYRPKDFDSEKG
jgi:hypothetical protein